MAYLEIDGVQKDYGTHRVVHTFDLSVQRGEFVSLLGPSGCGKTTTLRMVAGFETPTTGSIRIDGTDVTGLRPNQRRIGMVFQSYALFPNMTVAQNVAFGLKITKRPEAEIHARADEVLGIVGLRHLADRYPYQLSGGQQQRVALARAIATKPRVLLLDEPLSALDAKIRIALRQELKQLQRELGITTIYVTHDQEEALSMSDRIVVMSEGRIEQIGAPFDIYNFPRTRFVASFVGTLNALTAVVEDPASGRIVVQGQKLTLGREIPGVAPGGECAVAVRPEAVKLGAAGEGGNGLKGRVTDVAFLGSVVRVWVEIGTANLAMDMFSSPGNPPPRVGETVDLTFSPADLQVLEGTGPEARLH